MYSTLATALLLTRLTSAINVNINSASSISDAAKTIVSNVISIYDGKDSTGIPGLFPKPYFWWESGLAWDSLIQYASLTNDTTYNDRISQALLWQVGPNKDYMPPNQTSSEGNDDQSTWALACMTAEERGFPEPTKGSGVDSWLQLAQNVFNDQVARWDQKTCDGGLRWQIETFTAGYDYKNALSNGNFMQLAARLYHYTGNSTYNDWAQKVSKWTFQTGLIDTKTFTVWDGFTVSQNCSKPDKIQWSANLGTYLSAFAYLFNSTSSPSYREYISSLVQSADSVFVKKNILTETACASNSNCNADQLAYRAIAARAMAAAKYLDPSTAGSITPILQASAKGAAAQCSGGKSGDVCGSDWSSTKWDGTQGLSQDLSALNILLANLDGQAKVETSSGSTTSPGSGQAQTTGSGSGSPTGSPKATGSPTGTGSGAKATGKGAGTNAASSQAASQLSLVAAVAFAIVSAAL